MNLNELHESNKKNPDELKELFTEALGGWRFTAAGGVVTVALVKSDGGIVAHLVHPDNRGLNADGLPAASNRRSLERWLNDEEEPLDEQREAILRAISFEYGIPMEELKIRFRVLERHATPATATI